MDSSHDKSGSGSSFLPPSVALFTHSHPLPQVPAPIRTRAAAATVAVRRRKWRPRRGTRCSSRIHGGYIYISQRNGRTRINLTSFNGAAPTRRGAPARAHRTAAPSCRSPTVRRVRSLGPPAAGLHRVRCPTVRRTRPTPTPAPRGRAAGRDRVRTAAPRTPAPAAHAAHGRAAAAPAAAARKGQRDRAASVVGPPVRPPVRPPTPSMHALLQQSTVAHPDPLRRRRRRQTLMRRTSVAGIWPAIRAATANGPACR